MTTYLRDPRDDIAELHRVVRRLRRTTHGGVYRRRRRLAAGLALVGGVALVVALTGSAARTAFAAPSRAALAGLDVRQRVVALVDSQLGYRTVPAASYCNKYSAFWGVGSGSCPGATRSEEWCADFAAWAWRRAGVAFAYGYADGDINAGAISFYTWALQHGRWRPVGSGYRPEAGDVAVYGLSLGAAPSAAHVAVVIGDGPGGPDVVNGDGSRRSHSAVERVADETSADTGEDGGAPLAGYVQLP